MATTSRHTDRVLASPHPPADHGPRRRAAPAGRDHVPHARSSKQRHSCRSATARGHRDPAGCGGSRTARLETATPHARRRPRRRAATDRGGPRLAPRVPVTSRRSSFSVPASSACWLPCCAVAFGRRSISRGNTRAAKGWGAQSAGVRARSMVQPAAARTCRPRPPAKGRLPKRIPPRPARARARRRRTPLRPRP